MVDNFIYKHLKCELNHILVVKCEIKILLKAGDPCPWILNPVTPLKVIYYL